MRSFVYAICLVIEKEKIVGWFSNPKCPKCGRETTLGTDGLEYYYQCSPCIRKAMAEKEEKQSLLRRIEQLERKMQ